MSEEKDNGMTPTEEQIPSEIESLKERAKLMNIPFSPNIGLDTLRERVNAKMGPTTASPVNKPKKTEQQKQMELVNRQRKAALRLIRVVVQCMNPNKKDMTGEIFTIGNGIIGTVKKFVPFNIEAGYHIPHIVYEMMRDRKYQHFVKKKAPGRPDQMISTISDEFAIKVMEPLTAVELKELKERQALNHSIDS